MGTSWLRIPVAELQQPKEGICRLYLDRWWMVDRRGNALFYKSVAAPQCSISRDLCLAMVEYRQEDAEVVFLAQAYVPLPKGAQL